MKKLRVILVESALELVPREIWGHPAVAKNARRRGKRPGDTILDVSLHYHAMKNLSDREKRGRPDIVHISLLNMLESPLNKEGLLEVYVHTYPGHVIFVDPSVRLPRNYNRFIGLMEQLLKYGKVPPKADKPLLYVKTMTLKDLLETIGAKGLVLLDEEGEKAPRTRIVEEALENNYAIGIGGFPHGGFSKETLDTATRRYAIYDKPLTTWVAASRIIEAAEALLEIIL